MGVDRRLEELCTLYGEKGDEELLGMHDRLDDLTSVAQEALAQVMRERHLRARGPAEAQEPVSPLSGEPEETLGKSEVLVYLFHDAFEAREAMRHMGAAEIEHRMLDWHSVDPEMPVAYTGVDLGLVVAQRDLQAAKQVLKEKLGLFPGPEGEVAEADGEMVVLGMFDRADALVAAQVLGAAGISYLWRDGQEDAASLPDEETVAIEVRPASYARANELVESKLGG
jgi:hypothetical protein